MRALLLRWRLGVLLLAACTVQAPAIALAGTDIKAALKAKRAGERAFQRQKFESARDHFVRAEGAIGDRRRALELELLRKIARSCEELGDFDCAETYWDWVSRGGRPRIGRSLGFARTSRYRSDDERALGARRDLLGKLMGLRARGKQSLAKGQYEAAMVQLEEALSADPFCPGSECPALLLRELAEACAGTGEFSRAVELFERYKKALPKAPDRRKVSQRISALKRQIKKAAASAEKQRRARRVRLPRRKVRKPRWLRPESEIPRALWFDAPVFGERVAVAKRGQSDQWFGYEQGGQVLGPLPVPKGTTWMGMGDEDVVYAADTRGALYRAKSLAAVAAGELAELVRLRGVSQWDAAGPWVIALNEKQKLVHLSADHGESFTEHRLDHRPRRVFVRFDGAAVVEGDGVQVSNDGGKQWEHSPLGGVVGLQRVGAFIGEGPSRNIPTCAQGALSADGRSWVAYGEGPEREMAKRWEHPFRLSSKPDGAPARESLMTASSPPPPPSTGTPAEVEIKRCEEDPHAYFSRGPRGGVAHRSKRSECITPFCMLRPEDSDSTLVVSFFSDGSCGDTSADLTTPRLLPTRSSLRRRRVRTGYCGPSALQAPPSVLVDDVRKSHQLAVPEGCVPTALFNIRGAALLACGEIGGKSRLWSVAPSGAFAPEVMVTGRIEQVSVAGDGTVLVQSDHEDGRRAWVRAPAKLGASEAWRELSRRGAHAYRPAPGGRAISLEDSTEPLRSADVASSGTQLPDNLIRPGTHSWRGVDRVAAQCYANVLRTHPDLAGAVELSFLATAQGSLSIIGAEPVRVPRHRGLSPDARFWALADRLPRGAKLEGEGAELLLQCLRAEVPQSGRLEIYERGVQAPVEAELTRLWVFHSSGAAFSLWLDDGKPQVIADKVVFDDAIRDVAVRKDRGVEVRLGDRADRICQVPKSGALLCESPTKRGKR